jgi:Virulence factor membrane-bound polymerase, C-terminal/O-Antigen ligase/Protein glycosylation ligase
MFAPRLSLLCFLIAVPWLNPFTNGPSAAVLPWIASLLCVGLLLLVAPLGRFKGRLHQRFAIFLIAACALFYWANWLFNSQNLAEALATTVALLCVLSCGYVGAALGEYGAVGRRAHAGALALAVTWLAVALASCVMAQLQYFGVEHVFAPWVSASGTGEAFANLRQRNQFATLTGVGLAALLFLLHTLQGAEDVAAVRMRTGLAQTNSRRRHRWLQSTWAWWALALLAVSNAASTSRTGFVQWLMLAALVWVWRAHVVAQVRRVAYAAVPMYIGAALLMPWVAQWADNAMGNSFSRMLGPSGEGSRLWLYANVMDLIAQAPWTGWGWRELAYAHYSHSFAPRSMLILDNAHNLPLHLAVELGVPVALAVCGAVLWAVWRAAPWRETDATRQLAWAVLMLLAVHSMTEYPLWYGPFLMTLGLCAGLLMGRSGATIDTGRDSTQSAGTALIYKEKRRFTQYFRAQAAIILIAFAVYAWWDYWRINQIYLSPEQRSAAYADDTLHKVSGSWLFKRHVQFAELVTTPVTPQSAPRVLNLAADLIHFSPEPRVIELLIESAVMLHLDDVAAFHLARYKEAFPKEYAAWSALGGVAQ